jgi:hypothetical protein
MHIAHTTPPQDQIRRLGAKFSSPPLSTRSPVQDPPPENLALLANRTCYLNLASSKPRKEMVEVK